jgi:uncharacterized membrane protein
MTQPAIAAPVAAPRASGGDPAANGALARARAHWAVLTVGALTLLAFALRYALVHDSLLGDELFMFQIVHGHSLGEALHIVRETEKTPPLFFILVWGAAKLGDPTVWLRAPSLLFGTALVPLVYALGLRTVGRTAGVLAAAMIALDPFAIFYGTEARAYGALAFLAGLSTLCLLWALESGRRRAWVAYGLAVLAVAFTHYMGVFVLLVQALWAFWVHRERLRTLLVVHGLVVLAFLPWLPSFLVQERHSGDEAQRIASLTPPSLHYLGDITLRMVLGHPFAGVSRIPGRTAVIVALAVIAAAAGAALLRAYRSPAARPRLSSPVLLLALAALATPVGIGLISLRPDKSFMLARNLSASLPAVVLVVAWLLIALRRRAAVPAVAALLAVLVIGAVRTLNHDNRRSDYRAAAAFIDARARPGDPVIQTFFLPVSGALEHVLTVNFDHPHPFVRAGSPQEAAAWAHGRRGGHVFVVFGLGGFYKSVHHVGRVAGPRKDFVRVADESHPGLENVLVGEYRYAGP